MVNMRSRRVWLLAFTSSLAAAATFEGYHKPRRASSVLSFRSATCNISNVFVPVTYELGSMSFGNQSHDVARWNARIDNGTFVHGNSQLIISDDSKLDNPACINRCCVFDTRWLDTGTGIAANWVGACQAPRGLMLMPGGAEDEPYDNVYYIKAEPSPECPEGSAMTTFQPNVVYVESLSTAGMDIIRLRYHAFVIADAPDPWTWTALHAEWKIGPVSSAITHDIAWYRYRALKQMVSWRDLPDADDSPNPDEDPNVLTEAAALAMLFAASVAIITQPRGSIFHRWHVPLFWRLVPGYALLETLVILLLTILVSLRTRTLKSVIIAILVYRDPVYIHDRRLSDRYIVDAVMRTPGFYQSRSIALFTTLPFVFLFVKIFAVEGAVFLSAVCLFYAVPWVVLQAIVLSMPKGRPDDDFRDQIKVAVEDIKHLGRLINSETSQHGEPGALLNAQLMTPDVVADLTVCFFSNLTLFAISISHGKLLAIQSLRPYTDTVALELLCGQAVFFFGMVLWYSVSFFAILGLFIHFGLLGHWLGRLVRVHSWAVRFFFLRLVDGLHLSLWGAAIVHSLMSHEPGETYRRPWFERMPS